jgi:hypothetical protein
MHIHLARKTLAVTSAAALLLGIGGAAGAAITASPVSGGVIYGCYTTKVAGGSHALVLQDKGTSCPSGDTAIKWNQKGPTGPAGPQGPPGAKYQFYEAVSPDDTYPAGDFSPTPNSYGQYVGEASVLNIVYCAPGDTMLSAQVVINNFYQADKTAEAIQSPTAVANGFSGFTVILNPTQDPIPGGTTYYVYTKGTCMTSGTPPVGPEGDYQDPRDS